MENEKALDYHGDEDWVLSHRLYKLLRGVCGCYLIWITGADEISEPLIMSPEFHGSESWWD